MNNKSFTKQFLLCHLLGLFLVLLFPQLLFPQTNYFPAAGDNWERRTPEQVKIDAAKLKEAIDFAIASESKAPRNLELAHYQTFGREPFGEAVARSKSAATQRESLSETATSSPNGATRSVSI